MSNLETWLMGTLCLLSGVYEIWPIVVHIFGACMAPN